MSLHFSANQYEGAYRPWRLGTWAVPKTFPSRPRIRKGRTKIIANDRGHLLRGGARTSPWGPLTQNLTNEIVLGEKKYQIVAEEDLTQPAKEVEDAISDSEKEDTGGHKDITSVNGAKPALDASNQSNHAKSVKEVELNSKVEKLKEENLQVTGWGVLGSPRTGSGSSGSLTPASFRRVPKHSPRPIGSGLKDVSKKSKQRSSVAASVVSALSYEDKENIIQEAAKLPSDTIEDALLPRTLEGDILEPQSSRALAIRLVEHPGATNCTKFTVLRPFTAPTPEVAEPPSVPTRPRTSALIIREIPEIEYALKWDLKSPIEEEPEDIQVKKKKSKEPQTPRSITSEDSGVHIPKTAWDTGPDKAELTTKLEALKQVNGILAPKGNVNLNEIESGYATPVSVGIKNALPNVKSRKSAEKSQSIIVNTHNGKPASHNGTEVSNPSQRSIQISKRPSHESIPSVKSQERISIDSKCLSATFAHEREKLVSRTSSVHSKHESEKPTAKVSPKLPVKDPLEIMETIDSVFQKVPLRKNGPKYSQASHEAMAKEFTTMATQTDEWAIQHNHVVKDNGTQIRFRNCMACEVRAREELPRKYVSPAGRTPFRFGKMEQRQTAKTPRYVKQSDKYTVRLKPHSEAPRLWKINTLSSPFNNRPGYGQDQYPSHLRLRSTYEMAHSASSKPQHESFIRSLYK